MSEPARKIFAGTTLRETRTRAALTQRVFAERLGISLPYLSQMENNHRPVSALVLIRLASEFGVDVGALAAGDAERLVVDMAEALADPVFSAPPPLADLRLAAGNAPALARAFLDLYRAHHTGQERLAALDELLGTRPMAETASPWEEVRDFFHYCDNYIDAIDRDAEYFASRSDNGATPDMGAADRAIAGLKSAGLRVELRDLPQGALYRRDGDVITLATATPTPSRVFRMLHLVALEARAPLLEATLDLAHFRTIEARNIARIGLANYWAGAALMPYRAFLAAARELRHDLERLAHRFDASLEQVAHRLSTLQRPGEKGVAFFFVRVDPAGTITKRHSATRLQFARFGGGCPLWNVHQAFETPGRFLRQLCETPDGVRYFCLSRDVSKSGGAFGAPVRRQAISLGCEVSEAGALVYADGLDLNNPASFEPIGISCRICPRTDCHQRAVPPIDRAIITDGNASGPLPYRIG